MSDSNREWGENKRLSECRECVRLQAANAELRELVEAYLDFCHGPAFDIKPLTDSRPTLLEWSEKGDKLEQRAREALARLTPSLAKPAAAEGGAE